eukprot:XP_011682961.1 PREDICTED: sushi, nidogen and EGF-like domain-containing protein 1 [Strongylocentrotus purpuratus]
MLTIAFSLNTVNPCSSTPCQSGGQCNAADDFSSFTCQCVLPYTGTTCNLMHPCSSTPCQSGGQCNAAYDFSSFTCQCVSPYTGTTCNLSPCDSNPCLNGGGCGITATGYMCNCPEETTTETSKG